MDLMFHDVPLQQLYVEGKFMFLVAMMEKIDFQQLKFIILQKVHGQPYHQSYRFLYQMQQLWVKEYIFIFLEEDGQKVSINKFFNLIQKVMK